MPPVKRQFRGFTLLELVLVMVLITITLAIAAPQLRGFSRGARNHDTAMQLMALCRWSRTQAISEARVYRLNIEAPQRYYLTVQDQDQFTPAPTDMGEVFNAPPETQILVTRTDGGVPDHIDFYPDGRADQAIISVMQNDHSQRQVVCDSPTQEYRLLSNSEALR